MKKKAFDKYAYYIRAVQSPEGDVEFIKETYEDLRGKKPQVLREDFCGTFALCCEWVKLNRNFKAVGIDLDPEPLTYGKTNYFSKLTPSQKKRVEIRQTNVLSKNLPAADIICAMNFSYFIFKQRVALKKYFQSVRRGLKKNGIFVLDLFGGSACYEPNVEETAFRDFTYLWDQESMDAIQSTSTFHIHFRVHKPRKLYKKVFSYDWRIWTIPEVRDLLSEVGFSKTVVLWEGITRRGDGDGNFKPKENAEADAAWVAYVVALK